jgi:hypothetical protein
LPPSQVPTFNLDHHLHSRSHFHPRHALQRTFFSQSPSLRSRRCPSPRQVHPFSSRSENAGGCGGAEWGVLALYIDLGDDLASVSRHPIYILATPALLPSLSQISFASLLCSRTRIVALLVAVAESESQCSITMGSRSPVRSPLVLEYMSCPSWKTSVCVAQGSVRSVSISLSQLPVSLKTLPRL